MPARRHPRILVAVIAAGIITTIAVTAGILVPVLRSPLGIQQPDASAPTWGRAAESPTAAKRPKGDGIASLAAKSWIRETYRRTGIPKRALAAYAGAQLELADEQPECGLAWNTLAAIGFVESRHGSYGGSVLRASGTISPGIYGIALDGSSTAHIPDSDDGKYDGDPDFDRAVGPMQMIPQSWRNWRADGNGDGRRNPQNIDDAVLAAGRYLCRAGEDLGTRDGWRDMIATYNSAPSYLTKVALQATIYAG